MTLQECTALLVPYALALRADIDAPTFRAYHKQLEDVSIELATHAIDRLAKGGLRFFPTAPEIRQAAEAERRALIAAHPYTGCAQCELTPGWEQVNAEAGQATVRPCRCREWHRAKLAKLGVGEPLALEAAAHE